MKKKGWEPIFKKQGRVFLEPQKEIKKLVKEFKKKRVKRILDLGCGTGRHVVYLAKKGFEMYGFDISRYGIKKTREWLKEEGLEADLRILEMSQKFPYKRNFFDAVISTYAIHHNNVSDIKKTLKEVWRVLKSKGLFFVVIPSHPPYSFNKKFKCPTKFKQIEPNTFIPLDGIEKGIPHHVFNEYEIKKIFKKFKILEVKMGQWGHYDVLVQKP